MSATSDKSFFADARERMVVSQLITRGVKAEAVLGAFRRAPRELFVPDAEREQAYDDYPLPIGHGQTISQPYMVALMTELLRLPPKGGAKVLEIGSGSGYQAAILALMGHEVYSVERIPEVAALAGENLRKAGLADRVAIKVGDGCLGWPENAPYAGIVVTAAAPKVPPALIAQLADNGRLIIPVGDRVLQVLSEIRKKANGTTVVSSSIACRFVPLIGKDAF